MVGSMDWNNLLSKLHEMSVNNMQQNIGAWKGVEHGNVPPPQIGKNCCRNLVVFSKALFIATTFPDLVGKSFLY